MKNWNKKLISAVLVVVVLALVSGVCSGMIAAPVHASNSNMNVASQDMSHQNKNTALPCCTDRDGITHNFDVPAFHKNQNKLISLGNIAITNNSAIKINQPINSFHISDPPSGSGTISVIHTINKKE